MKKLLKSVICTLNIVIECTDKVEFLVCMVVSSLLKQTNVAGYHSIKACFFVLSCSCYDILLACICIYDLLLTNLGSFAQEYARKIIVLQKKAIRLVCQFHFLKCVPTLHMRCNNCYSQNIIFTLLVSSYLTT